MKEFRIDFIDPNGNEESAYYDAYDMGSAQEMFLADFGDDFVIDGIVDVSDDAEYDESMDGDFDSAMASAGFGTDEDYGYYGEE